jgi:hypothetical protein
LGAFRVEYLIQDERFALAGLVFGLSAVALSLTTALQSIVLYKHSYDALIREGKMRLEPGRGVWWYALRQDFTNPARLGLFIGALSSPLVASVIFSLVPILTKNGWVLALLGSVESVVASVTVLCAAQLNRWRFRAIVRRAIRKVV